MISPTPDTIKVTRRTRRSRPRRQRGSTKAGHVNAYQMFTKLLGWIVLRTRSDTTKEIEILVPRHQLAVLQRRTPTSRTPHMISTPTGSTSRSDTPQDQGATT